jgi:DnaJ-class molecular chaperone
MNSSSDEARGLLSDDGQWTEPWGSSEDGASCDKCGGAGRTQFECWSCVLTGARPSCPVCAGRIRWEGECPVCRGTTRVDGKPRHGVSVFPTEEGLYHYMLAKDADLGGCVIVELDARQAEDPDFDADQGAMLVLPARIVGCWSVDRELAAGIQARTERIAAR